MNLRNLLEDALEQFAVDHQLERHAGAVVMTTIQVQELLKFARGQMAGYSVPWKRRGFEVYAESHDPEAGTVAVSKLVPTKPPPGASEKPHVHLKREQAE